MIPSILARSLYLRFLSFQSGASAESSASRRLVAALLVFATVFAAGPTAPLFAQAAAASPAPKLLQITILEGEDTLNNVRERTAREPVVQVEDENHKPVAGALILFSIQNSGTTGAGAGAGASFNGLSTLSVTTGADGRAVAHGITPSASGGSYSISVTATLGTLTAATVINVPASGGAGASQQAASSGSRAARTGLHFSKKALITGATVVAVGVIVGVVIATRGPSATTITPGQGTVGP